MSVTWYDLDRSGDPVHGNPETFDVLETQFRDVRRNVRKVNNELQAIRFGGGEFRGKAADTFEEEIASVDNYLDDFGDVCQKIELIMDHHGSRLRALRREASNALARAQTHWNSRSQAEQDREHADGRVRSLRYQIDSLSDEDGGSQRQYLERRCDDAEWDSRQASRRRSQAEDALNVERTCWDDLHRDEEELSRETSGKLRNVDLESLANPNWISQRLADLGDLKDFAFGALAAIGDAIARQMDGWLGDFLDWMYDFLDVVLLVLAAVSIVLALTGVGAPIAALIGTVALVLSAVKLGIGLALKASGREISWGDLAWDAFGVITAGSAKAFKGSLKAGGLAAKHVSIANDIRIMKVFDGVGFALDVKGLYESERVRDGVRLSSQAVQKDPMLLPRTLVPFAPSPLFGFHTAQPRSWSLSEPQTSRTRCMAPTGW